MIALLPLTEHAIDYNLILWHSLPREHQFRIARGVEQLGELSTVPIAPGVRPGVFGDLSELPDLDNLRLDGSPERLDDRMDVGFLFESDRLMKKAGEILKDIHLVLCKNRAHAILLRHSLPLLCQTIHVR